ncbi:hypothetical protein [Enterobacter ludwigii]|uniref:hypothetical protein n=1 Tax=Enterobacter ludwigii TaxID=299767 RepID=UPI00207385E9|nr:hypothetical protein [Enterobacter ludwigii]
MALEPKDLTALGNSLIGLIGVLAGGALTHYFNERRTANQAARDEIKENRKLILQKGEELHQLLNEWKKYVSIVNIFYHKILMGTAHIDELNAYTDENKSVARTHDRLDTLLSMYFPDLLSKMHSISAKLEICNSTFHSNVRSPNQSAVEKLFYNGGLVEKELDALQSALRDKMKLPVS